MLYSGQQSSVAGAVESELQFRRRSLTRCARARRSVGPASRRMWVASPFISRAAPRPIERDDHRARWRALDQKWAGGSEVPRRMGPESRKGADRL